METYIGFAHAQSRYPGNVFHILFTFIHVTLLQPRSEP